MTSHYNLLGYALATRVLQSDLYTELDDLERSQCDELIKQGQQQYGCHCEIEFTLDSQPDDCVFDNGDIEDCIYATELQLKGKGRNECSYWRPIRMKK